MTICDLENEVATPKFEYFVDITLKLLFYEFGKPSPNGFPNFCLQAQISKTFDPW